MPFHYRIFPDENLVYYRGEGIVTGADAENLFEQYATHPDAASGQNILADLRALSEVRMDMNDRLRLQARMEPVLSAGGKKRHYVMFAPTALSQKLAETFREFWSSAPLIKVVVVTQESAVSRVISLPNGGLQTLAARLREEV